MAIQFEVYRTTSGGWKWRIRNENTGRVLARSQRSWAHPGNCHAEIIQVQVNAADAVAVQERV